ncbi:putative HTLV-1-related endogenous sequence [Manis pentadactyla]|uniref:putative HTLV-1-related endogenous sequence n=1 Tax=Manis pentadactyla TaxID=143292 RepID=UPI00255CEF58|nr:putative HTLV-1-related endogenous sequence [Manis pentadactyla]
MISRDYGKHFAQEKDSERGARSPCRPLERPRSLPLNSGSRGAVLRPPAPLRPHRRAQGSSAPRLHCPRRRRVGRCAEGRSPDAPTPPATLSLRGSPRRHPPSPRSEGPARELPAEARAQGPPRRAGLRRSLQPAAASPRRRQHRAAEARGRRKPEEGGAGWGRRGHESVSLDLEGEQGRAQRRPESRRPRARALSSTPAPGSPATAPSAFRAAGSSSCSVAGARCAGAAAAPKVAEEGAMRRETGASVPGAARQERRRAPTFRAGRTGAARPYRASRTGKSPRREGRGSGGRLQDKKTVWPQAKQAAKKTWTEKT